MCGIVGIYSLNNTKIPNLKSRLKKMIEQSIIEAQTIQGII